MYTYIYIYIYTYIERERESVLILTFKCLFFAGPGATSLKRDPMEV